MDTTKDQSSTGNQSIDDCSTDQQTEVTNQNQTGSTETVDNGETTVKPRWIHNKSIGFYQLKESLEVVRDQLQNAITEQQAELNKYMDALNRFR